MLVVRVAHPSQFDCLSVAGTFGRLRLCRGLLVGARVALCTYMQLHRQFTDTCYLFGVKGMAVL